MPSQIAACSLILSINIYELDAEKSQPTGFFKNCMSHNGLLRLNTDIWNNQSMHELSGYSICDLTDCLHELSVFISTNLQPNRLECFDIAAIKSLQKYDS